MWIPTLLSNWRAWSFLPSCVWRHLWTNSPDNPIKNIYRCKINTHSIANNNKVNNKVRLLIVSQVTEWVAYYNQILLASSYINNKQKRRLIDSFGYCYHFYFGPKLMILCSSGHCSCSINEFKISLEYLETKFLL